MNFRAGEVFWEFSADRKPLLNEAEKTNRDLGLIAEKGSAEYSRKFNAERLGRNIGSGIKTGLRAGLVGAAAIISGGLAFGGVAKAALTATRQISDLSQVAGISAERFQELRFAANQVNSEFFDFEGTKLADIFKDVNDKFGDFFQTGAGPLADFFDQIAPRINITKEAFRGLSGDEALGLYIKSLEEAGVNQQDLSFFMEALGSDATALLPLFRDNATALGELSDRAREGGLVLSNEVVQGAADADRKLDELGQRIRTGVTGALVELAPQIESITDDLIELIPVVAQWTENLVSFFREGAEALTEFSDRAAVVSLAFRTGNFSLIGNDALKTDTQLLQAQAKEYERLAVLIKRQNELRADFDPNSESDRRGEAFLAAERQKVETEIKAINAIIKSRDEAAARVNSAPAPTVTATTVSAPLSSGSRSTAASTFTPENIKEREEREKQAVDNSRALAREEAAILKERLDTARRLFEDAQTPIEQYQARLEELAAFEQDSLIFDAAGGAETFGRQRIEALVELAQSTGDYEMAMRALGEAASNQTLSLEQAATAMEMVRDALDVDENAQQEVRERLQGELDKRVELNEALLREAESRLVLARLRGDTDEIEMLERQLELLSEKNILLRGGATDAQADAQANSIVSDRDAAEIEGKAREAFKSGFRDAIEDGPLDALKNKLAQATDNMFDAALDTLFDALSGGLGGIFGGGGGGGGIGGFISTALGFMDGGYTGDGGRTEVAGVVHKGEFVANAMATSNPTNRAILERMNRGLPLLLPSVASGVAQSSGMMRASQMPDFSISIDATGADAAALNRVMNEVRALEQTLPQRFLAMQRDQQIGAL